MCVFVVLFMTLLLLFCCVCLCFYAYPACVILEYDC